MKILYFTKGDSSVASSNERVWIAGEYLKKNFGHESEIISARNNSAKDVFSKLWRSAYDIIVVHKSLFSAKTVFLIALAKLFFRKPFIYDLDDAQWLHSPIK